MEKLAFPIVAVMGPTSNGQTVHPGLITFSDNKIDGLVDMSVLDDELDADGKATGNKVPLAGLIGRCNATIFPDLGVPHPAASLPLFDSFESAEAALERYAAKKMKFVGAYHVNEEMDVEQAMRRMQKELDGHAAQLSTIIATHFPDEQEHGAEAEGQTQEA